MIFNIVYVSFVNIFVTIKFQRLIFPFNWIFIYSSSHHIPNILYFSDTPMPSYPGYRHRLWKQSVVRTWWIWLKQGKNWKLMLKLYGLWVLMSSKWLLMSHFPTVPLLKIQLSFVTASLSLLVLVTLNELVRSANFPLSLSLSHTHLSIWLFPSFLPFFLLFKSVGCQGVSCLHVKVLVSGWS